MEPCYWAMYSCSSLPIVILLFWPVLYTSYDLTCIDWILDVTKNIYEDLTILGITNVAM